MKLKRLNARGFSHDMLIVLFVAVFAIAGVAYLVASHANSCSSSPCTPVSGPQSAWTDWTNLGLTDAKGTFQYAPSATLPSVNNTEVYTVDSTHRVAQNVWVPSRNKWSGWKVLSASNVGIYSSVASASTGPGNVALFGRDGKGAVEALFEINGVWQQNWTYVGGRTNFAPAAIAIGKNIDVFYTGTNGAVYGSIWNGSTWASWTNVGRGKNVTGSPALTAYNYPHDLNGVNLFVNTTNGSIARTIVEQDTNGQLMQLFGSGYWLNINNNIGTLAGVTADPTNTYAFLFGRLSSGVIQMATYTYNTQASTAPASLGGNVKSKVSALYLPASSTLNPNNIILFAQSASDNAIYSHLTKP